MSGSRALLGFDERVPFRLVDDPTNVSQAYICSVCGESIAAHSFIGVTLCKIHRRAFYEVEALVKAGITAPEALSPPQRLLWNAGSTPVSSAASFPYTIDAAGTVWRGFPSVPEPFISFKSLPVWAAHPRAEAFATVPRSALTAQLQLRGAPLGTAYACFVCGGTHSVGVASAEEEDIESDSRVEGSPRVASPLALEAEGVSNLESNRSLRAESISGTETVVETLHGHVQRAPLFDAEDRVAGAAQPAVEESEVNTHRGLLSSDDIGVDGDDEQLIAHVAGESRASEAFPDSYASHSTDDPDFVSPECPAAEAVSVPRRDDAGDAAGSNDCPPLDATASVDARETSEDDFQPSTRVQTEATEAGNTDAAQPEAVSDALTPAFTTNDVIPTLSMPDAVTNNAPEGVLSDISDVDSSAVAPSASAAEGSADSKFTVATEAARLDGALDAQCAAVGVTDEVLPPTEPVIDIGLREPVLDSSACEPVPAHDSSILCETDGAAGYDALPYEGDVIEAVIVEEAAPATPLATEASSELHVSEAPAPESSDSLPAEIPVSVTDSMIQSAPSPTLAECALIPQPESAADEAPEPEASSSIAVDDAPVEPLETPAVEPEPEATPASPASEMHERVIPEPYPAASSFALPAWPPAFPLHASAPVSKAAEASTRAFTPKKQSKIVIQFIGASRGGPVYNSIRATPSTPSTAAREPALGSPLFPEALPATLAAARATAAAWVSPPASLLKPPPRQRYAGSTAAAAAGASGPQPRAVSRLPPAALQPFMRGAGRDAGIVGVTEEASAGHSAPLTDRSHGGDSVAATEASHGDGGGGTMPTPQRGGGGGGRIAALVRTATLASPPIATRPLLEFPRPEPGPPRH